MLVLSRRTGENIKIGDCVTLSVLAVKGNVVRLGIHAPRNLSVHREEVCHHIQKERESEPSIP